MNEDREEAADQEHPRGEMIPELEEGR